MAEALVAAPVLSAAFNVLFVKMASKEVLDFFKQRKLNDEVLQKLKRRMNAVSGLLEDAEEKHITKPAVRKWLDDLKDVAYDADDFLNEIAHRTRERLDIEADPNTCSGLVLNFFSSFNPCKKGMGELVPRLENILATIEDLLKQKESLNLEKRERVKKSMLSSKGRLTTSLVDESGIYGRDDDKEAIVKSLLSDDKFLDVIPIVGMGGVGKTTLSQLVYKDHRVKQRFDKLKAWICVSDDFDVLKLTKDMLKELGSSDCDLTTLNQLQLALEEKVKGQRILLVLDDVWNNNHAEWELLLAPLKSAAQGSKVLITTREERIASLVSTVPSYHLKVLSKDDCWSLFAKHAFESGDSDGHGDLERVGREIVKKCKGLPLAAKTIGNLLRLERRIEKWEKILKSNMWDLNDGKIIPALRLSYHYLPSHLKQCFAYCAMFPKDFPFHKQNLILLWMAEGFIVQHNNEKREMEEIGEDYFEDLLSRSFFQKYEYEEDVFLMHDLINDLAKSIAGEFCYNNIDDDNSAQLTERTRHLFYKGQNPSEELVNLSKAPLLRTFFIRSIREVESREVFNILPRLERLRALHLSGHGYPYTEEDRINISELVSSAKYLRFMRLLEVPILNLPETLPSLQTLIIQYCLNLSSLPNSIGDMKDLRHLSLEMTGIVSLPDSISNLKVLRHLDLGYTLIERLPDSICGLYSLQYLSLSGCGRLVELPVRMKDLLSLCHLYISSTKLKSMPPQMGKLVKLRTLSDFIVNKGQGSSIAELGHLRNLQGRLVLRNLQNVADMQNASEANLKDKSRLKGLEYVWEDDDDSTTTHDTSVDRSILHYLQPPVNVEYIRIEGYRGISFPNWVGDSFFSNVVSLGLYDCKYCTCLPPLGQLASLKYLDIEGFDSIVKVGAEFYGDSKSIQPFRSLLSLEFRSMPMMKEWTHIEDDGCMVCPLLEYLSISCCPELEMALRGGVFSSTLQKLTIIDCNKIIPRGMHWDLHKLSSLPEFAFASAVDIQSFPGMILLPSSLVYICISDLPNLKSLDYTGLHHLTSLQTLEIWNCPNLGSIPDEGLPQSLHNLLISYCPLLEKRCQKEQGEDWPKISHIQTITIDDCQI